MCLAFHYKETKERVRMEHIMLTRAWVIHIFLQFFRLFNIVRGNSFISVHRERDDVGKVDDDLLFLERESYTRYNNPAQTF